MTTSLSIPPPDGTMPMKRNSAVSGLRSILVVSIAGIGNTILATPLLRALRQHYPAARIDLLVWNRVAGTPVDGSGVVDHVLTVPRRTVDRLRVLFGLRAAHYDLALTVFPSNKPAYHVFAFLTGARMRVAHAYRGGWRRGEWLLTDRIAAQERLHDVDQNLALLGLLGISPAVSERVPFFHVGKEDHAWADAWIRDQHLEGTCLVGMHPGAGTDISVMHWQGLHKRWPMERFADVARRLIRDNGCTVLLTGGPEEEILKEEVRQASGVSGRVLAVSATLPRTAALLSRCSLMISNDSGLMHVAAAVGVPVLAIFGPTQAGRTAPVGARHRVVRKGSPCSPCLKYPFSSASSRIRCPCQGACLRDITAEDVYSAACDMLKET